jgi:hypothetical protein
MSVSVTRRCLRLGLISTWVLIITGGLWAELWKATVGRQSLRDWVYFFGLSYERNLPTWYTASLLVLCASCLMLKFLGAHAERSRFRWHWLLLSLIFCYISLDETVGLHEKLSLFFDFSGPLYFGWVIPAGIFVLIVGLAYLPLLGSLEPRIRWQFVLAGAVYVGGALGVEMLLGWWTDFSGSTRNLTYGLIDLAEEGLEIMGATLFLLALIELLAGDEGVIKVWVD